MSAALLRDLIVVLPIVAAGLAHQIVRARDLWPGLSRSLDEILFGGREVFGANKTLRGFVVVPVATGVGFVAVPGCAWWAGFAVGLAYVAGELPNSLLKRRLGISPGAQATRARPIFFVLDHVDSALACALVLRALGEEWPAIGAGLGLAPGIHVLVNRVSYALGLRKAAW